MNKELEEAIKNLNKFAYTMYGTLSVKEAKVILNYIENSIPKKKVEEEINFIKTLDEKLYYQENVIRILQELLEGK